MKKYGFREPEPSQLFETLRAAATGLLERDPQLHFQFNHFLMKHSSVNGLVSEETVRQMYDMIIENARRFLDAPSGPDARAVQKGKDRRRGQEQMAGKRSKWRCLSLLSITRPLDKGLPCQNKG